jgi:hypothetical protein
LGANYNGLKFVVLTLLFIPALGKPTAKGCAKYVVILIAPYAKLAKILFLCGVVGVLVGPVLGQVIIILLHIIV